MLSIFGVIDEYRRKLAYHSQARDDENISKHGCLFSSRKRGTFYSAWALTWANWCTWQEVNHMCLH